MPYTPIYVQFITCQHDISCRNVVKYTSSTLTRMYYKSRVLTTWYIVTAQCTCRHSTVYLSSQNNVLVVTAQCTCRHSTVYLSSQNSVLVDTAECTCRHRTVYLTSQHSVLVFTAQCTCRHSTVYLSSQHSVLFSGFKHISKKKKSSFGRVRVAHLKENLEIGPNVTWRQI
jgi:hypothetical protein